MPYNTLRILLDLPIKQNPPALAYHIWPSLIKRLFTSPDPSKESPQLQTILDVLRITNFLIYCIYYLVPLFSLPGSPSWISTLKFMCPNFSRLYSDVISGWILYKLPTFKKVLFLSSCNIHLPLLSTHIMLKWPACV